MFLFHSASVVSATGADDAMPALETIMSRPPKAATVAPTTVAPTDLTTAIMRKV